MEMETQDTRDNPVLGREEHTVRIEHQGEATPSEDTVRKKFAAENDYDPKKIEVRHVYTGFGAAISTADLRAYEEEVVTETEDEADDEEAADEAEAEEEPEEAEEQDAESEDEADDADEEDDA